MPTAATTTLSTTKPNPFLLKGDASVSQWTITASLTIPAGSNTPASTKALTEIIKQDASGGDINFDIPISGLYPGETISISAQGVNSSGFPVIGQIALVDGSVLSTAGSTTTLSSSITVKVITLNNNGVVTGLPSTYTNTPNTYYLLVGANGITDNHDDIPYTYATLTAALQNNSVLNQYFTNKQLFLFDLAENLEPVGYSPPPNLITINGTTVALAGSSISNWSPALIESPVTGTIKMWSVGSTGNPYATTINVQAGVATNFFASSYYNSSNTTATADVTKIYFTDASNNAIVGLKVMNAPLAGGVLTASSWSNAPSSLATAKSIYTGTVSQILASKVSAPAGSLYYIVDTIGNIQAAGAQLAPLVASNQILGAGPTNGFAPIAQSSSSGYAPIPISDSSGNTSYIRTTSQYSNNEKPHAVLAVKTSASTTVTAYIDGVAVGNASSAFNGISGWTLPSSTLTSLGQSSSVNHIHQLSFSAGTSGVSVQFGIVPPGGGYPTSYSSGPMSIWVGAANQLPTSIADISANTLYIVSDEQGNLVSLVGAGVDTATASGVVNVLASQGLLAYNPTHGMGWVALHELEQTGQFPIANISGVGIYDSAYIAERQIYQLGNNQGVYIRDTMARLLSAGFQDSATQIKNSGSIGYVNTGVQSAFNNQGHIQWSDTLATLTNPNNLSAMSAVYSGSMKLGAVFVHDSVANINSPSLSLAGLTSFVNSNANGLMYLDVRDSVANISAALTGSSAATFEAKLASIASGVNNVTSRVELYDSVANLVQAYNNGTIGTIDQVATQLLSSAKPTATNLGLALRVIDNVANIEAFLRSGNTPLLSKVTSYVVQDTAANIAYDINNRGNWDSAVGFSNNIIVRDSFTNVKAFADQLFGVNISGLSAEATKVIFTDISGASASNPLVISPNYSYGLGQLPQFDFSQAAGFVGVVTATESVLSTSNLPVGYTNVGATGGVALTISDASNHQVVIDILTSSYGTSIATDPHSGDLYSVYLPTATSARTGNISQFFADYQNNPLVKYAISDTSVNIAQNLNILQDVISAALESDAAVITSIRVQDSSPIITTAGSLASDGAVISLLPSTTKFAIEQTASADIAANIDALQSNISQISSIRITDPTAYMPLTVAQANADSAVFAKFAASDPNHQAVQTPHISIADTASHLDGLDLSAYAHDQVELVLSSLDGNMTVAGGAVTQLDLTHLVNATFTTATIHGGVDTLVTVTASGTTGTIVLTGETPNQVHVLANYSSSINDISTVGVSPDGSTLLIGFKSGASTSVPYTSGSVTLGGTTYTAAQVSSQATASGAASAPVFTDSTGGGSGYILPTVYTGPVTSLHYQLLAAADGAVITATHDNTFIALTTQNAAVNKAVNGNGGQDVISGGVGSSFIAGGTGHANTFFLDGRTADVVSWSTITDFILGTDSVTIWGWNPGNSSLNSTNPIINGAGGAFNGLTLYINNLSPDGSASNFQNSALNQLTLSTHTLSDFGFSTVAALDAQLQHLSQEAISNTGADITASHTASNGHFTIGQTTDSVGAGVHWYLNIH